MSTDLPQNDTQSPVSSGQTPPPDDAVLGQDKKQIPSEPTLSSALPAEQKETAGMFYKEAEPKAVEKKEGEIEPEVKEWVTEVKKEEAIELPVPLEDEYGQVLMESVRPIQPRIVLPLDDQGIKLGLKKKVTNSIRWLVTWCLRLIKMFPERVSYKKNKLEE